MDYDNLQCEIVKNDKIDHNISFKIVVVGNAGVGKSSLTSKAVENKFNDAYKATVGFEFFSLNYKIKDKIVKLQIWDTCGQEVYRSLVSNFYRSSSLAILLYSIDSKESFVQLEHWLTELRHFSNPDIKIFLIGNKSDLAHKRQVSYENGLKFKEDNNLDYFIEASAKLGLYTEEIFKKASITLYKDYLKYKTVYNSSNGTSMFNSEETKNSSESFKLRTREERESKDKLDQEKVGCRC